VKSTGDGVLLEFPSVVDAVECAVAVQAVMAQRNEGVPGDRRMLFRIGINLGDILIEGDDILGDGVNIAARLEGIAQPGGICISSSAYDQVRGKVQVEFTDLGEQTLKNIARPIRAYAVARDGFGARREGEGITPSSPSAPHLSIVVLPFANIGGDPERDYFVDGVTESLTTDLSRINGAFVIARNSAFTFKGKAVDVKKLGRELNVRYVLEGSVQHGGSRLRINAQLIDAETGNHLWAERFDKPVADLFDMQDEIVSRLANTLDAKLIAAEARRAECSANPDVMDLVFQGKALVHKGWTRGYLAQARGFFERALGVDPKNVEAMVWKAGVDVIVGSNHIGEDRTARLVAAEVTVLEALSLAPNHAFAHFILGEVLLRTNRGVQAIAENERALELDRNLANAHASIGRAKLFMGCGAETEAHMNEAFRVSPRDILAYDWLMIIGFTKLSLDADTEAAGWFRRSIEGNRNHPMAHFGLAAALGLLGSLDQARAAAKAGLALNPNFTLRSFRDSANGDNPTYLAKRERIYQGLRIAGVPE
jgi:TolB-like protein